MVRRCHAEQGFPIPKVPIIFNKFASCIVGDGDAIVKPAVTEKLDFEVELVIVIGKVRRHPLTPGVGRAHVGVTAGMGGVGMCGVLCVHICAVVAACTCHLWLASLP